MSADTPTAKSGSAPSWIISAVFLGAIAASWAWFNVGVKPREKSYVLHSRETVPGYKFKALPVGEQAIETLATTNLVNGQFEGQGEDRFIVFAADWAARGDKQMSVLAHTPEICWVGAGFSLMDLGEPPFMEVEISGQKVPFECRVFRAPDQHSVEMVAWCSVVSGQWLEEGFRFQPNRKQSGDGLLRQSENARARGMNSLVKALVNRQSGDGTKQFVRFSTGVRGDWNESYQRLQKFAAEWLTVEVVRNEAARGLTTATGPASSAVTSASNR
jgi:hypothetical protein